MPTLSRLDFIPIWLTDFALGSPVAVAMPDGAVVRQSFSPWGIPRAPFDWTAPYDTALVADRGFTGHVHLGDFGLIDMGGRVYDPALGRFLSPDPFVQAPTNSQNFNRYAYCLNNPLKYTDPSGEFWWIPVLIGAYLGGSAANDDFNPTKWDWSNAKTYGGIVVGGLAGWAGAGVGANIAASAIAGGSSAFSAGIAGGMMGGMTSGGINGFGMTLAMGGKLNDAFGNMIQGAVTGGFAGAAGAAAFQGMNSFFNMDFPLFNGKILLEDPLKILPTNTLSYMAGSTASQITANIVNGRKPFENVDYGFNIGIILPACIDIACSVEPIRISIARKHNSYKDREIIMSDDIVSITELTNNGDLNLSINVDGFSTYPEIDYISAGYIHGDSFNQIFNGYRPESWPVVVNPFIKNYRNIIQTILTLTLK